ncbi:MAG TPA: nicotinate phosphoribosyltransferase [Terriglobales bacterium]|nr:nicotinate phosphoribosyltransferase [Terriglobales bacterium]
MAAGADMLEGHTGLYTDMYELTMAEAYFRDGTAATPAVFDYFFRTLPFGGGFVVFAGLGDALDLLEAFRFDAGDLDYLRGLGFAPDFLERMGRFRFRGAVHSIREGEVVFPLEPVLRVEAALLEAQLVETALLNILNFESLIATKAARLRLAAGPRLLSEFGLRRSHGPGGVLASRAAVIGGCDTTSDVYAARRYGLKPTGTMAHSYIESHGDELTAFRRFAEARPEGCIFLVDTYDTLRSGMPNAIRAAKEMEGRGDKLYAVRLDSGDLAYLAKQARRMLDESGLGYVRIMASNLLDEHVIRSLLEQGAPIDLFGVGTRLATGAPDGALDGVYKLAESGGEPRLKVSESLAKTTLPGRKAVVRCSDAAGEFGADAVVLADEPDVARMVHPFEPGQSLRLADFAKERLHVKVMEDGRRLGGPEPVARIAAYAQSRLAALPPEHKRFENPHVYKVGLSDRLAELRDGLVRRFREEE